MLVTRLFAVFALFTFISFPYIALPICLFATSMLLLFLPFIMTIVFSGIHSTISKGLTRIIHLFIDSFFYSIIRMPIHLLLLEEGQSHTVES